MSIVSNLAGPVVAHRQAEAWIADREQIAAAARGAKDPVLEGYLMLLAAHMKLAEAESAGKKSEDPGLGPQERARLLLRAIGVRPEPDTSGGSG
jgi:hypothetical protein